MNDFGALVVAELCEAIADFVDKAPAQAAATARRMGTRLREQLDTYQARRHEAQLEASKRGVGPGF